MSTLHHDARLFAALGHPNRLALFQLLARHGGRLYVEELRTMLAEETGIVLAQPTISFHLRLLVAANLIDYQQHGTYSRYFVCPEGVQAMRALLASSLPEKVEASV